MPTGGYKTLPYNRIRQNPQPTTEAGCTWRR
jgi:hypothetical protein